MNKASGFRSASALVITGLSCTVFILPRQAQAQCEYQITEITTTHCPPPVPCATLAASINNAGAIAGSYQYYEPPVGFHYASFVWTQQDGFETLNLPSEVVYAKATDINDAGQVVGLYNEVGGGGFPVVAYYYDAGTFISLGTGPGGSHSVATAINNSSQVVGYWQNLGSSGPQAFVWQEGEMIDLGPILDRVYSIARDINNLGQITGCLSQRAFILDDGEVTVLPPVPGGDTSCAQDINELGQVVGSGIVSDPVLGNVVRAFLWSDGQMIDLGELPGLPNCRASDINNASTITGVCSLSGYQSPKAFIWQNGVMSALSDLVAEDACLSLPHSAASNDAGQIVSTGRVLVNNIGETSAILLTPQGPHVGDLNGNNVVDAADLAMLLGAWGPNPGHPADINSDGVVNAFDLASLLANWGPCPIAPVGACCDNYKGYASCGVVRQACCAHDYLGDGSSCDDCPECGAPGTGDCCAEHDTPHCEDQDCCLAVCSALPTCCEYEWDSFCAAAAQSICPSLCGG